MADRFRIALAQLNLTLGAIDANADKLAAAHARAVAAGADLLLTPEMGLVGYQPQDLILKPAFVAHAETAMAALARRLSDGPPALIGGPTRMEGGVYNALHLIEGGAVQAIVRKVKLPNYGVFDEKRVFAAGPEQGPIVVKGVRIGAMICEDAWTPDVSETLQESGAEILLAPNGSPYARGKHEHVRLPLIVSRVVETGLPFVYLNLVGGQDDQIFDGGAFALNPGGALALQMPYFEEAFATLDFVREAGGWRAEEGARASLPSDIELDYQAMVLGTRDYFAKTGHKTALLGLSGGVDSALVAAIAADALGPEAVRAVMLPSRYTSRESLEDAAAVAERLGCRLDELSISEPVGAAEAALAPIFAGAPADLTEENIQSRMRGLLLMAISNKSGALLLTTGNKSEVAVGYATLYGDMCGAYNPLKDLYKTRVFATCRWRSAEHRAWMRGPAGPVIPERVIEKPPSAELRDDQKDEDSLPPYDRLDAMLEALIDRDESTADLIAQGFDAETVRRVERLIYISEYKRRQAAPGPKLTEKAFWLDRRYPLANRWRDPA